MWAGECVIGVITLAPPITDVSLCFTHNTSRRPSSKSWHPPSRLLSIWKDLMMNNKATGLHIYYFLHKLSALLPRIQFGWDLKQTAVKAAGSGGELGSDHRHAFRSPGQTDWLSLSDPSGVRQGRRCCAAILGSGFQQERRKWWWRRKWNKQECVMTAKTRMFVITRLEERKSGSKTHSVSKWFNCWRHSCKDSVRKIGRSCYWLI